MSKFSLLLELRESLRSWEATGTLAKRRLENRAGWSAISWGLSVQETKTGSKQEWREEQ